MPRRMRRRARQARRIRASRIGGILGRRVQAVQPADGVSRTRQRRVQLAEFADRGLVRVTVQQDEDVDVAAGGAEVAGDQRAVQVHPGQAAARQQPVQQPLQEQGDVRWKRHPVLRHQRSG
jgi:hypothetical protein